MALSAGRAWWIPASMWLLVNLALLGGVLAQDAMGGEELDDILRLAPPPPAGKADGETGAPEEKAAASEPQGAEQEPRGKKKRERGVSKSGKRAGKERHKVSAAKAQRQGVTEEYLALKASWHAPAEPPAQVAANAAVVPALVFHVVGEPTPFVLIANSEQGGFGPEQIAVARAAFRGAEGGPDVNARLLDIIYRATRHFGVPYVHLVSGIRRDRGASRHTHGLAADVVLPGVSDDELAAWFRTQGFVGVGVYTRAGFVHVDVREQSFFWIDPSPPGKKFKIRPERMQEAKDADAAAVARGEQPHVNPVTLSKALERRNAVRRKHGKHAKVAGAKRPPG